MYKNDDVDYLKVLRNKKIFIFGAGKRGRKVGAKLVKMGYHVLGYIDNDREKQGLEIHKLKITGLAGLQENLDKDTVIIISSKYESRIKLQLMENGIFNFISESQIDFGGGEDYYDETYFEWQRPMGEFGAKVKRRLFEPYIPDDSVLVEFGCGGGYLLNILEAKEKVGIEINDVARENAQHMGIRCVKNISEIPDNYADVIISNSVLEHVENPLGVLRELHSKLKEHGKVVFYVPNESCDKEYRRSEINNHLYTWNCLNIGNLFKAAGFFVHSVQRIQEVWPKNYTKIESEISAEFFDAISEIGGNARDENRCLIEAYK